MRRSAWDFVAWPGSLACALVCSGLWRDGSDSEDEASAASQAVAASAEDVLSSDAETSSDESTLQLGEVEASRAQFV